MQLHIQICHDEAEYCQQMRQDLQQHLRREAPHWQVSAVPGEAAEDNTRAVEVGWLLEMLQLTGQASFWPSLAYALHVWLKRNADRRIRLRVGDKEIEAHQDTPPEKLEAWLTLLEQESPDD